MNRISFVTPLSIAIALGLTGNLWAQDRPTVDVAGGYAFSYITNNDGTSMPTGWFASVAGHLTPNVAIVGEGTGAYKSQSSTFSNAGLSLSVNADMRLYTYQAGPRILSSHMSPTRVFGQFLIGAATLSATGSAVGSGISASSSGSETHLALTPGGGIEVRATDHIAVRFIVNFQLIHSDSDWGKVFHTGVGIVWTGR